MKRGILSAVIAACFVFTPYVRAVNTGNQAADIVETARSQLGYTGNNKHTKYNTWFYTVDQAAPWCAIFISWCANEAGIPNSVIGKNALASGFNTYNMENNPFGTDAKSFESRAPVPGDIAFIDNDGDGVSNHVALVSGSDNYYIYTIEGNVRDKVVNLRYDRSSGYNDYATSRVLFYAVPDYASVKNEEPEKGLVKNEYENRTELYNNSTSPAEVNIIIAEYDNGRLSDVSIEKTTLAPNERRVFDIGENMKLFAWNGMKPAV